MNITKLCEYYLIDTDMTLLKLSFILCPPVRLFQNSVRPLLSKSQNVATSQTWVIKPEDIGKSGNMVFLKFGITGKQRRKAFFSLPPLNSYYYSVAPGIAFPAGWQRRARCRCHLPLSGQRRCAAVDVADGGAGR